MNEGRFDELAKGLATNRFSRGQMVRGLAAEFDRRLADGLRGVEDALTPTLLSAGMRGRVRP